MSTVYPFSPRASVTQPGGMKASTPPGKSISDSQALAELKEILGKPFKVNCHRCEGKGTHKARTEKGIVIIPCQLCQGTGVLKMKLI